MTYTASARHDISENSPRNRLREFDGMNIINVLPGNFHITTNSNDVITTLLGSCVSACIRDPMTGIGGLNHFLLPATKNNMTDDNNMRYGDYAMEVLIGSIIRAGGERSRSEVKLFGGGNMYTSALAKPSIGQSNIKFVRDFILSERLKLIVEDLGGNNGRKIYFHPATGKVKVQKLPNERAAEIKSFESSYTESIADNKVDDIGTIELFG